MRETEKARSTYEVYVKYTWDCPDRNNSFLMAALMFLCDYHLPRDMKEAYRYLRMLEEIPEAQEDVRGMKERLRGESPPAGPSDDTIDMADTSDCMVLDTSLQ